ncbi:MAG: nitroreductase family protein [Armatimonadota bacterium]|nr:nitroreductase family protein [bacterium]
MEYSELIAKRYSVRAYKPDPVEPEKLQRILETARLAPTACNNQPFRLIVIETRGRQAGLKRIYKADWFAQAPLIICGCAVPSEGWVRRSDSKNHAEIDLAIVMDHLILAAANEGLGTCWIAAFDPIAAREALDLPDDLVPVIFTPLGYPADPPRPKVRRDLAELVRYMQ